MTMGGIEDWSAVAADDADRILTVLGPLAQQMVVRDEALWPIGVGVRPDGQIEPLSVSPEGLESTQEALEFLIEMMIINRDSWRTVCVAIAIDLPNCDGALQFNVENIDGHSIALIMRYRASKLLQTMIFDEFTYVEIPPMIWGFNPDEIASDSLNEDT